MAQAYAESKQPKRNAPRCVEMQLRTGRFQRVALKTKDVYIPSFLRHDETFLSGCQVQKSGEKEKRKEKGIGGNQPACSPG